MYKAARLQAMVTHYLQAVALSCLLDLVLSCSLMSVQARKALSLLVEETSDYPILCIVGMPVAAGNCLYNCAVVFQSGKILGVVPKSYLPNYKEFYEERWFTSGISATIDTIELCGDRVPFGTDLLFESAGVVVGVELCEDLWVPIPPSFFTSI